MHGAVESTVEIHCGKGSGLRLTAHQRRQPGAAGSGHIGQQPKRKRGTWPRLSSGASGAIRTPDPQVRSLVLYPTELRTHKGAYYLEGVQVSQGITHDG
jgi:hypothetical protein